MRFHWVSQNKTGNEEVAGGYMWATQADKHACLLTFWWSNVNFCNVLRGLR